MFINLKKKTKKFHLEKKSKINFILATVVLFLSFTSLYLQIYK